MENYSLIDRLFLATKKLGKLTLANENKKSPFFILYVIAQLPTILYLFVFNLIAGLFCKVANLITVDGDKKLKAFFDITYFKNPIISFVLFITILYYFLKALMWN